MKRIILVVGLICLGVMMIKELAKKTSFSTTASKEQFIEKGVLPTNAFEGTKPDTQRIIGKHPLFADLSVVSPGPLITISTSLPSPELGRELTKRVG